MTSPSPESETCTLCSQWAARTRSQLDNRLRNIEAHPQSQVYRCPNCGSQAWARTNKFIGAVGGIDLGSRPRRINIKIVLLVGLSIVLIAFGLIGALR